MTTDTSTLFVAYDYESPGFWHIYSTDQDRTMGDTTTILTLYGPDNAELADAIQRITTAINEAVQLAEDHDRS